MTLFCFYFRQKSFVKVTLDFFLVASAKIQSKQKHYEDLDSISLNFLYLIASTFNYNYNYNYYLVANFKFNLV